MACSQWDLMTPLGLTTQTGDGAALLAWEEPGTNLCADEMISQLPHFVKNRKSCTWEVKSKFSNVSTRVQI